MTEAKITLDTLLKNPLTIRSDSIVETIENGVRKEVTITELSDYLSEELSSTDYRMMLAGLIWQGVHSMGGSFGNRAIRIKPLPGKFYFSLAEIQRWHPSVLRARWETHLEVSVWFKASDGKSKWSSYAIGYNDFETPEDLLHYILSSKTSYVRENWVSIEVHVPNRDAYGNLKSGYIKDTGVLLARNGMCEWISPLEHNQ